MKLALLIILVVCRVCSAEMHYVNGTKWVVKVADDGGDAGVWVPPGQTVIMEHEGNLYYGITWEAYWMDGTNFVSTGYSGSYGVELAADSVHFFTWVETIPPNSDPGCQLRYQRSTGKVDAFLCGMGAAVPFLIIWAAIYGTVAGLNPRLERI